jgi:hypothetical protein
MELPYVFSGIFMFFAICFGLRAWHEKRSIPQQPYFGSRNVAAYCITVAAIAALAEFIARLLF